MGNGEKYTYYLYSRGFDENFLTLGNLAFSYRNPEARDPYIHEQLIDQSTWATADKRPECFLMDLGHSSASFAGGLAGLLGLSFESSLDTAKVVVGKNGSRVELTRPQEFFQNVILKSYKGEDWLRGRLVVRRKFAKLRRPTIWMLTGLIKIEDARFFTLVGSKKSIGGDLSLPVIEPTGVSVLMGLSAGGNFNLGNGRALIAGGQELGVKVWAARWQKVAAKFSSPAKFTGSLEGTLRLADLECVGGVRGPPVITKFTVEAAAEETDSEESDEADDESTVEYWKSFNDALDPYNKELAKKRSEELGKAN